MIWRRLLFKVCLSQASLCQSFACLLSHPFLSLFCSVSQWGRKNVFWGSFSSWIPPGCGPPRPLVGAGEQEGISAPPPLCLGWCLQKLLHFFCLLGVPAPSKVWPLWSCPVRQSPPCYSPYQTMLTLGFRDPTPPLASCCQWSLNYFLILSLSSQFFHHSCKSFPLLNFLCLKYLRGFCFPDLYPSSILFSTTVSIFQFLEEAMSEKFSSSLLNVVISNHSSVHSVGISPLGPPSTPCSLFSVYSCAIDLILSLSNYELMAGKGHVCLFPWIPIT